jgi:hypothetical protein
MYLNSFADGTPIPINQFKRRPSLNYHHNSLGIGAPGQTSGLINKTNGSPLGA